MEEGVPGVRGGGCTREVPGSTPSRCTWEVYVPPSRTTDRVPGDVPPCRTTDRVPGDVPPMPYYWVCEGGTPIPYYRVCGGGTPMAYYQVV